MNNYTSITPSKIKFGKYIAISFMMSFVISPFVLAFALNSAWYTVTRTYPDGEYEISFLHDRAETSINGTQSTTIYYSNINTAHVELIAHASFVFVIIGWVFCILHVVAIVVGLALSKYNIKYNTTTYWSVVFVQLKKPLYLGTLFLSIICMSLSVLIFLGLPEAMEKDLICDIFPEQICPNGFIGGDSTNKNKWGPDFAWIFNLIFVILEALIFVVLWIAENWRSDVVIQDYNETLLDSDYSSTSDSEM